MIKQIYKLELDRKIVGSKTLCLQNNLFSITPIICTINSNKEIKQIKLGC